jgi:hypothetical protein
MTLLWSLKFEGNDCFSHATDTQEVFTRAVASDDHITYRFVTGHTQTQASAKALPSTLAMLWNVP